MGHMMNVESLTLELVPHCASVRPRKWTGEHSVRPLSELGHQQAAALVAALGTDIEAIYSSPALRCIQTVQPLAQATGLPIVELPELLDTQGFAEPAQWTQQLFKPVDQEIGGAWAAGHGIRALATIARQYPDKRAVAASHGDIIPALLAMLCAAFDVPLPKMPERGGWHTIHIKDDRCTITMHGNEVVPFT